MADPRFFDNAGPLSLTQVAEISGGRVPSGKTGLSIGDAAALDAAGAGQLAFCEGPKFKAALERTHAGFVLVPEALASSVPSHAVAIVCAQPALSFAKIATALYPHAGQIWPAAKPPVHAIAPTARVGEGTIIAPYVFIGEGVEIGDDCLIGPGAVIGRGVQIGRKSSIGSNATVTHALIGDRCTIYAGARIGQEGFGFVGGATGHYKIPQLGRVIIQDDVEIGAGTAVDRGALSDTVIGEGTKIDNLVQIGHNTRIGRHCRLAAQVGFSGSCEVGDFVMFGGQVGVADHLKIGRGAVVAAKAGVTRSLEGGKVFSGFPARPVEQWRREVATVSLLTKGKRNKDEREGS